MGANNEALATELTNLIASCPPGWTLPQPFYRDAEIYRVDVDRVWRRGWLFAGYTCQIRQPGDFFVYEVDTDALIVMRDDSGTVVALFDTCRHRGTRICLEPAGHVNKLVCPYHQWSYGRDGTLLGCGMTPEPRDAEEFSLHRAPCRVLEGLIFVSLATDPPPFDPANEQIAPQLRPHGFDRAKVAATIDYEVEANWKIVWENNRECLHCAVGHPQYVKANYDIAPPDNPEVQAEIDARSDRCRKRWAALGLPVESQLGLCSFPDGAWYGAHRTPLVEGWVTESMDGAPVAPLMGDFIERDMGTLRIRAVPNFWCHASSDHAVASRLTPAGPTRTRVQVTWLVHQDAIEGVDYDLLRLLPFWQLTSEQDWALCRNNQAGVNSSRYRPGPYSPSTEYNVDQFVRWYLDQLRGSPAIDRRV